MLRQLLSLPADLVGSLVLSKLELPDIVRLDTALLVKECRSDALAWYLSISPVIFDDIVGEAPLMWLFQRNVRIGRLEVDCNEQLLQLIGEHFHLVVDGIALCVDCRNGAFWEDFQLSPDVLCNVGELTIDATDLVDSVELDAKLPFRLLKSLTYNSEEPCNYLASLIRNNPLLRELNVTATFEMPLGFAEALVEKKSVLTRLNLGGCNFTSHELQLIADSCPLLTALNLQMLWAPQRSIDSGAIAFVQRCPRLESIELDSQTFSQALLTVLLTHGLSLNSIHTVPELLLSDTALAARPSACSPLRRLTCRWGVTTLGAVAAGGNLLSGIKDLNLKGVNADSVHTLSAGLRSIRELSTLSLSLIIAFESPRVNVLPAVAQGCSQLTKLTIHAEEHGDFADRLTSIVQANPALAEINMQSFGSPISDALVLVLAENCANLRVLKLSRDTPITDASVTELASRCPNLSWLYLAFSTQLTNASVHAFAEHCRDLHSLYLERSVMVKSAAVTHLMRSCRKLRCLNVSSKSMSQATFMKWRRLKPYIRVRRYSGQKSRKYL
jgi:hypothetical protein